MQEKFGFVYIWYDSKRKMYYIGSHWGTEEDGYICSSNRMRDAYRRRPQDFKRRVLSRIYTDRLSLLNEEQRWFDMVKNKDRYYNLHWTVRDYSWRDDPLRREAVSKKISRTSSGRIVSDETKAKLSAIRKGKPKSAEHKAKIAEAKKGKPRSVETKAKISASLVGKDNGRTGKNHTEETKAKISASHKKRHIENTI